MHVRFGSGIAIAATLAALSGCGGSSSSSSSKSSTSTGPSTDQTAQFKSSFVPAVNGLRDSSRAIGIAIQQASSKTNAQISATFHALAGRWQSQLAQLQKLKAPPKFAADFATLTGAATRVKADLDAVVTAATGSDKNGAHQAGVSLIRDILTAKSASTSITGKLGSK